MTDMDPLERIIWSADVADEATLMGHLDRMPDLRLVKVDRLLATEVGLGIVDRLNERGLRVFDDAKIIEIPSKAVGIAEKHLAHRPWMLNCMAGVQSSGVLDNPDGDKVDGLKRFAQACHAAGTKPCGVTVLTSKRPGVVEREFNGRAAVEQVLYYVEALLESGFTDVVCSAQELAAIRAESRFDVLALNVPGIRPAGADVGDQARVQTPLAALDAGADRLVIGRPITVGDPHENLNSIIDEIAVTAA
jgi:orotidine-5'-phosphate decarboxylase